MKITTTQTILKPTATIKHQKKHSFSYKQRPVCSLVKTAFVQLFCFFAQVVRQLTSYLTGQSGFLL